LIPRKIIKTVATRCYILKLRYAKFNFRCGSAPDPAGGAYSAHLDPLAGFKGPISKRRDKTKDGSEAREGKREERGSTPKARGKVSGGIMFPLTQT